MRPAAGVEASGTVLVCGTTLHLFFICTMRRFFCFPLALLFSIALLPDASAQGRGKTSGSERRPAPQQQQRTGDYERDGRYEREARDDRDRRDRGYEGRKNGPPFCASGAGHPVHGRQWCHEKGYRVGNDRRYDDRRDRDRVTLGDIIFGRTRSSYPNDRRLSGRDLDRLLGVQTVTRIEREARRLGFGSALTGRWQPGSRADRLHLYAGNRAFATLLDTNRDGRVDAVRFAD